MRYLLAACVLSIGLCVVGCSDDVTGTGGSGGGGGAGGMAGAGGMGGGEAPTQTSWAISDVEILQDDCDFGELTGTFTITTDGSNAMMMYDEFELDAETDEYSPELSQVSFAGATTNDEFPPCSVLLTDEFTVILDDPSVSLPDNNTLQVEWDHVEEDASEGACEGVWFVPLPCAVAEDFTLTKLVE